PRRIPRARQGGDAVRARCSSISSGGAPRADLPAHMIGSAAVRVEQRLSVRVGEARVAKPGATLAALGLGSCVAVVLYDPECRVAGLAHVLLPDPSASRHPGAPARFATTAVPHLIRLMEAQGAARERLYAR